MQHHPDAEQQPRDVLSLFVSDLDALLPTVAILWQIN